MHKRREKKKNNNGRLELHPQPIVPFTPTDAPAFL